MTVNALRVASLKVWVPSILSSPCLLNGHTQPSRYQHCPCSSRFGTGVSDQLVGFSIPHAFTHFGCSRPNWSSLFSVVIQPWACLLYTSDAADERSSVD